MKNHLLFGLIFLGACQLKAIPMRVGEQHLPCPTEQYRGEAERREGMQPREGSVSGFFESHSQAAPDETSEYTKGDSRIDNNDSLLSKIRI